jgi:hypothetical protein
MGAAKRPQCTRFAASYYVETAYGQAFNDSAINKLFPPNEPILFDLTQTREDDSSLIKGHEFAVDTDADVIVAQDVSSPFNFRAYLNLLGWLFSLITGSDSVTGSQTAYTHIFKVADACINDQPPSTDFISSFVGDTLSYYKFKGACLGELKLAIDKPGVPTVSGTFFTDGTVAVATGFTPPTTVSAQDVIAGIQSDFKTCDFGGSLATKKTLFMGADFTVNQNLDVADGRLNFADSSKYLKSLRFGNRVVTLVVKMQGHQGDEFWIDFINKTVKAVEVSVTIDSARSIVIALNKATIASIKPGFNGIRDMNEITYKAYYNTPDASPFVVTIKNQDAAYLLPITAGM